MSVGRLCVREVDFADPDEPVWKAAERMHQRAVGTLVILGPDKTPIGMVTDRDLVERVMATRKDPQTTLIEAVMTRDPMTIAEDAAIEAALALMRSHRLRRLPVVGPDGRLVGLLSLDDVLMLLAEEFASIGRLLDRESPPRVLAPQGG